jgi:PAS domain S-box-containing protein
MSARAATHTESHNLTFKGQLEAARAINQRIFETSLDLILVVDRKGIFIRVSPSSLAILDRAPEEMIGHSAAEFIYPDDLENTRKEMREARRGRQTRNFDCRYIHKGGHAVPLTWTGVWSEPEQQHFFIGRDMTERIKLEGQLRHAQKMETIGQLTGGVAHDFNNILTVITSAVENLSEELAGDQELFALVNSIDQAAEHGAQLTQRMLAFARKQPLQSRAIDLNEIVARMVGMLQRTLGEDIAVETVLAKGLWRALADPSQVEDAILNLAVNARDAMPKGGRLLIETANVRFDEHYVVQNVDAVPGNYVAVSVTDSGTGMPPEVVERAFEPFFTTKDVGHGTGLGLSMVYGFVKQSRGHVKIYSEVGHGTSITLYLPRVVGSKAVAADASAPVEARASGRETILVVEDHAAVRAAAVNLLKNLGYQVLQAGDGKAALEILRGPAAIDLLFTDLIMPKGMSGQDLAREAWMLRPGLKVLLTSGYSQHFIDGRGNAGQSQHLLGKPYRKHQLASAIRSALDGDQSS